MNDAPADTLGQAPGNFIHDAVADDLKAGRFDRVVTRFPPEPNAYLHLGHAKAIAIDFGVAAAFGGRTNLRFDDTNPLGEEQRYIDAIKEDVRWLGFDWGEHEYHASDFFPDLYQWARLLVGAGLAYVDDQSADQVRQGRGTLKTPGVESPCRDRPADESLDLLERMRNGEFANGEKVLRARIDMASGNLNLRDPVMYRVLHAPHPRTGASWCIYPSYDWAHGQCDWLEGVTHSLCSLEFEDHRPLYDWFLDRLIEVGAKSPAADYRPRQIEFARGNIGYMVTSKRKLLKLIEAGRVESWDDPRMPTLPGVRRRGYPPEAILDFWRGAGVAKRDNVLDIARLEFHVRERLNKTAQRRCAVLDPLKVVLTNYPEGETEHMDAVNNPEDPDAGSRKVPFSRELFIERDDFMEDPPKKFFRLAPGKEVRLRYAYWITCADVVKDDAGKVVELHCTYDPKTRGGDNPPPDADGNVRKVKGTLHWVSAAHARTAEVRLYDRLFRAEDPDDAPEGQDFLANVNAESVQTVKALVEPALAEAATGQTFQFERIGYFTVDPDSTADLPVFNRTVALRDTWAKVNR